MINWNGRRYVPKGLKPFIGKKGVPVNGRPKAAWVASWVGNQEDETPPTPTPTPSPSPLPTYYLLTEGGDVLITESGDNLVWTPV